MRYLVQIGEQEFLLELRDQGDVVVTPDGGPPQHLDVVASSSLLSVLTEGQHREIEVRVNDAGVALIEDGTERVATVARAGLGGRIAGKRRTAGADVRAPMPGLVVAVEANEGDEVSAGQGVIILEAMKMQNELRTPVAGRIKKVFVTAGTAVDKGQPLVKVEE
jgi:biotin carboxyl carrier protein